MQRRTPLDEYASFPRVKKGEKSDQPVNSTPRSQLSAFGHGAGLSPFSETNYQEPGDAEDYGSTHSPPSRQPFLRRAPGHLGGASPPQAGSTHTIQPTPQPTAKRGASSCCSSCPSFTSMDRAAEGGDDIKTAKFLNTECEKVMLLKGDSDSEQCVNSNRTDRDAAVPDWHEDDGGDHGDHSSPADITDRTSHRPGPDYLADGTLPVASYQECNDLPLNLDHKPYSNSSSLEPLLPRPSGRATVNDIGWPVSIEASLEESSRRELCNTAGLFRSLTSSPVTDHVVLPHEDVPTRPGGPDNPASAEHRESETENDDGGAPLLRPSEARTSVLGSENLGLRDYLSRWAAAGAQDTAILVSGNTLVRNCPSMTAIQSQRRAGIKEVRYEDLAGDRCDYQGLDWTSMGVTRQAARERRLEQYTNFCNIWGSDDFGWADVGLNPRENFYRFQKTMLRRDVRVAHFQLRDVLASPARNTLIYPTSDGLHRMDPNSGEVSLFMDVRRLFGWSRCISTLDVKYRLCASGNFTGDYFIQSLDASDPKAFTRTQLPQGIINNVKLFKPRASATPAAAIATNDNTLAVMDVATQAILSEKRFDMAINSSATSPNASLRAVVGDGRDVLILDAERGRTIRQLSGHRDYCFACDWSEDGYTLATASQDRTIKIWDTRMLTEIPLRSIKTEMAGVRSLKFSPLGSGPRVLVAAEEADFIHVINAQTFESKQMLDIFGEIGGIDYGLKGDQLNILCADEDRGGILQFRRCGQMFGSHSGTGDWGMEFDEPREPHMVSWIDKA